MVMQKAMISVEDLMVVNVGMELRAKPNPEISDCEIQGVLCYDACLPAGVDAAEFLESMAEAIREGRLYGFMQQEAAECSVGAQEWVPNETLARPSDECCPEPNLPPGVTSIIRKPTKLP
jgi:hypothetical protein